MNTRGQPGYTPSHDTYRCDCSAAYAQSTMAGLQCEHPTAQVCDEGATTTDYALCINGGQCVHIVRLGQPHFGCQCLPEFEGRHCQYPKGQAPQAELQLTYNYAQNTSHEGGISKFVIVIIVLGIVVGFGLILYRKYQKKRMEKWETEVSATESDSINEEEEEEKAFEGLPKGQMA